MARTRHTNTLRSRRKRRVRSRIQGTEARPRLSVFRSNRFTYAQLINDVSGRTIASASTRELKKEKKLAKTMLSEKLGELIADRAKKAGVARAVFDKGEYKYHGRVRALTEGARKHGLEI